MNCLSGSLTIIILCVLQCQISVDAKQSESTWPPTNFFLFFQWITFCGGSSDPHKHPEKMSSLIKVYLHFGASKPPIKKRNFHMDTATISLVAWSNCSVTLLSRSIIIGTNYSFPYSNTGTVILLSITSTFPVFQF